MDIFYSIMTMTLIYSSPILITALGGLFSEKSGVVNIALEGLMMFGAFFAATVTVWLENTTSLAPWLGLVAAVVAGGLVSLLHAYLSINLKSDQVISGTAINLFALGMTIYLSEVFFHQQRTQAYSRGFIKTTYAYLSSIPLFGEIFFTNIYPTVFIAIILVLVSYVVLYKTVFGLRLRACGENPHAVDSVGVSVFAMRYAGVFISGLLAGLGGGVMVLTQDIQYTVLSIHGTGFIALAALIFGKWTPWGVLGASLFFGFSQILKVYSTGVSFLHYLPSELFDALPYILTVIALVIFSGKSAGPKAVGIPYNKGSR